MRRSVCVAALALCSFAASGDTLADEPARRAMVVARAGPSVVTVADLEDRISTMPPFQRATFGNTADLVRRRFLMEVLLPEALFSAGAEGERLGDRWPTSYAVERARSNATIRAIRARLGPASAIPMDDVQRYYDGNRARYAAPERYQIWRILCATREEAQAVLDAVKKDPTPKAFGDLAREHSLDKATYLRAGNLGFLTADGASNEPGLRVDPAVVQAARRVRDGELVAAPVAEGEHFSVVWRRGTVAATNRSADDVAPQIRDALWKARVKDETDKLLASLRATKLRDYNEALVDSIDLPPPSSSRDRRASLPDAH